MAVAVHSNFFKTLPVMEEVAPEKAEIAWLIYDLQFDKAANQFNLKRNRTVFTAFHSALSKITSAEAGPISAFIDFLQSKLDEKLEPPETATIRDSTLT